MKKILFVDDDKNIRASWARSFNKCFFEAVIVSSVNQALKKLEEDTFQLIITDYQMPGIDGVQFCRMIQQQAPSIKRIMLSGQLSLTVAAAALNEGGISMLLQKPVSIPKLIEAIESLLLEDTSKEQYNFLTADNALEDLEKEYPGITAVKKDGDGRIIL